MEFSSKHKNKLFFIFLFFLAFFILCNFSLMSRLYRKDVKAPTIINSFDDFDLMRNNLTGNFELGKDLTFEEGKNWVPINGFQGNFDGRYHKLANMKINISDELGNSPGDNEGVGIFGVMYGGKVQNLVVENMNVKVTGNKRVTGISFIIGRTDWRGGSVHRCTVTGNITYGQANEPGGGYASIGGIVGEFSGLGNISECAVRGNISTGPGTSIYNGSQDVGMIVGACHIRECKIRDCYSSGYVEGINNVGGLIGLETDSQIENCYSTVTVNYLGFGINRGGIIGWSNEFPNPVSSCYYDYTVNKDWAMVPSDPNNPSSPLVPENIGKGIPKNPTELTIKDTFTDWDFEEIWIIDPSINDGMPWLRWTDYDFAYGGGNVKNDFLGVPYWTYDPEISNECYCVFPNFEINPDKIPKNIVIKYTGSETYGLTKIEIPGAESGIYNGVEFKLNAESTDINKIIEIKNFEHITESQINSFIRNIRFFCEDWQEVNFDFKRIKNIKINTKVNDIKNKNEPPMTIDILTSNIVNPLRLSKLKTDIDNIENFSPTIYEYKIDSKESLNEIAIIPTAKVPDEVIMYLNNISVISNEHKSMELIPGQETSIFYITLKLKNNTDCLKTYELIIYRPNIISVSVPEKMFFQIGINYQTAKFVTPIYRIYNNSKYTDLKVSIEEVSTDKNNQIYLSQNEEELDFNKIYLNFNMLPSSWLINNEFINSPVTFNFNSDLKSKELGILKSLNHINKEVSNYGDYRLSMPDRFGFTFDHGKELHGDFNIKFKFEKK